MIHDIMRSWWISDKLVKSLSPTIQKSVVWTKDIDTAHGSLTLTGQLPPHITEGPYLHLLSKQIFLIFKRWLPFIRFCELLFSRPRDTKMMGLWLLAGVKNARCNVKPAKSNIKNYLGHMIIFLILDSGYRQK